MERDSNRLHLSPASPPKGRVVEGDTVEAIALLISGVVRVYKIGETGREITLYRFGTGESCILTANAILSRQSFPLWLSSSADAEAVLVPAETFSQLGASLPTCGATSSSTSLRSAYWLDGSSFDERSPCRPADGIARSGPYLLERSKRSIPLRTHPSKRFAAG